MLNLKKRLQNGSYIALILGSLAISGCKSNVIGEYIQSGTVALRLFDDSSGSLLDLKSGQVTVEVLPSSLVPGSDAVLLKLTSEGKAYNIRISKGKIAEDGSFELSESDLEQPVRIVGKVASQTGTSPLSLLIASQKSIDVEVKIFKGYTDRNELIGTFKTKVDSQSLKTSEFLTDHAQL